MTNHSRPRYPQLNPPNPQITRSPPTVVPHSSLGPIGFFLLVLSSPSHTKKWLWWRDHEEDGEEVEEEEEHYETHMMQTLRIPSPPPPTVPPPQKHRLSTTTAHQADPPIPSLLLNATTTAHVDSFADDHPTTELNWHYGNLGGHDSSFQVSARSFLVVIVAFSLLLLLALLCLYARWACWHRRLVITVTSSAAHGSPLEPTGGLDGEAIDGIPVVIHVGGDEAQCSICLSALEQGEKVKVLPACGHRFHPECVDEWLRAQPSCPLCRAVLGPSAGDGKRVELAV